VILRPQKQILRTFWGRAFSGLNELLKNGSFNEIMQSICTYTLHVRLSVTFCSKFLSVGKIVGLKHVESHISIYAGKSHSPTWCCVPEHFIRDFLSMFLFPPQIIRPLLNCMCLPLTRPGRVWLSGWGQENRKSFLKSVPGTHRSCHQSSMLGLKMNCVLYMSCIWHFPGLTVMQESPIYLCLCMTSVSHSCHENPRPPTTAPVQAGVFSLFCS
jgi:hypothetical protein